MKSHDTFFAEFRAPSFALCVGIVALITLVRSIGQHFSIADLYFDESSPPYGAMTSHRWSITCAAKNASCWHGPRAALSAIIFK
jgi:hypothetical protein